MTKQRSPEEFTTEKLPERLPILPLHETALYPKMVLPLVVMQGDSIKLVDEAMQKDRIIGLLVAKADASGTDDAGASDKNGAGEAESDSQTFDPMENLSPVGTSAMILKMAKTQDNQTQMLVQGISRFRVKAFDQEKPYLIAQVEHLKEKGAEGKEAEALMKNLVNHFDRVVELSPGMPPEVAVMAKNINEPGTLANMVASTLNVDAQKKQVILEIDDAKKRLHAVTRLVNEQLEILELGNKIQSQVKGDMEKSQREYYLRQQLKAIREELGETDDSNVELEEYRTKVLEGNLPEEARKEADRELSRLARMHPSSAEYSVATTYLDWITALPWHKSTEDNLDIKAARDILDADHFGLEKAKRRIVEHLAVRKLNPATKGPILCFVGPPGTGKTSLGRSVARAMGRKFWRISLGGVRDEAEIRGHRRTYVGAMPGRMIQALRRCDSNNPVFMLDEIDKLGSDFRGDPSSALLEVLDPEQNYSFSDHYLDVPFDLSRVMFITTANVLDTIPPPLLDRMEVLEMVGYTLEEKVKIANRYLIPRQREAHGLKARQFKITAGALKRIISGYTREAGLRNLEREIASICRGVAAKVAQGDADAVSVAVDDVAEYLGPIKRTAETKARTATPGVAMGLAWTPTGGEILFIEATAMKGQKGLTLTGQLGDVMKESATAALSYIRSHAKALEIDDDFFNSHDIHIHVPAGAIPKDGPSAGVTMLTALVSLFTNRRIKKDLAMTGEITLRGQVLPVGGIKEKVLGAHRAGIKILILPAANEKDLIDVPEKVRNTIQFHFVSKMRDVLSIAIGS
ncbi:MAG: endopeptidase La [Desulfobacteraceae bacterium]|nr:endopeptidase La [Desulfobacteraceae bacterium]MBC2749902.1 endopeptidase La [Desulfobacteraceae bacterium]